jgi:hypothetical protein
MKYRDFFPELFCEGCGCDQKTEEYPYGGYKVTQRDVDADEQSETHYPHKRRDAMGQEDADINNDGKIDLTDKMLKAKRDIYKKYLLAKKKGQKTL